MTLVIGNIDGNQVDCSVDRLHFNNGINSSRRLGVRIAILMGVTLGLFACSSGGSNGGGDTVSTGDPAPIVSASDFGDEFSVDSINEWALRHEAEGEPAQYSLLDINQSNPGMLTITPTLTPGWFAAGKAPLIYKRVTGNFSVETSVFTQSATNPALPPGDDFNSAGLMMRASEASAENYIMVNVGRQNNTITDSLGSEAKNTVNSVSNLELQPGSTNGRLTLCRFGTDYSVYRLLDNETQWTQIGNVTRTDFPNTVQVGMVVNGYNGPDITATFEYIRMRVPTSVADCTSN